MRGRASIDLSKLSAAAARPGIDTRIWLTLAVVKELGYDSAEGIFADVQFQPSGEIETCFVGSAYSGGQFGMYCPLRVGDTVLVAVPSGDPNNGPIIISRQWDASDPPNG